MNAHKAVPVAFRTPQHPSLGTNNWGGASPLLARDISKESLEQRYVRLNSTRTRDEIFPVFEDDLDWAPSENKAKQDVHYGSKTASMIRGLLPKFVMFRRKEKESSKKKRWFLPRLDPHNRLSSPSKTTTTIQHHLHHPTPLDRLKNQLDQPSRLHFNPFEPMSISVLNRERRDQHHEWRPQMQITNVESTNEDVLFPVSGDGLFWSRSSVTMAVTLRRLLTITPKTPNIFHFLSSSSQPTFSSSPTQNPENLNPPLSEPQIPNYPIASRTRTPLEQQFETWVQILKPGFSPLQVSDALWAQSDPDLAFDIFRWTAQQRGYKHNHLTYLTMIKILIEGKRFSNAETLVDEVMAGACEMSVPLYNSMIRFCCNRKFLFNRAFDVYKKMINSEDCKPNLETYNMLFNSLLRRFNKLNVCYVYLRAVRSLTKQMKASGVIPDAFVLNMIIKAYSKCLELDEAIRVFHEMGLYKCEPNAYTYGYITKGLCEKGRVSQGFGFYKEMKDKGLVPSGSTFMIVICSLAMDRRFDEATEVVFDMLGCSMSPDFLTYKTLLEGLCRDGKGDEALKLAEEFRQKDVTEKLAKKKMTSITALKLTPVLFFFFLLSTLVSGKTSRDVTELQIGVKYKPESCEIQAHKGDQIRVHYKGTLTDGTVFDSSFDRNDPIQFELGSGQVIKGWDQGLLGMCVGEKRKLRIPAKLGYGPQGSPPTIPGSCVDPNIMHMRIGNAPATALLPRVKARAGRIWGKNLPRSEIRWRMMIERVSSIWDIKMEPDNDVNGLETVPGSNPHRLKNLETLGGGATLIFETELVEVVGKSSPKDSEL
ncbi:hypothetical protein G4B88_012994 [Cannabis sativa]|uniref:peptidylprolyl isomerase n=1 Tax=Cannabis sativa TaxID=3483 RepID=A0A7J6FKP2_CANSA|nr:hypothetical protein G4B88_012994 [Cannabis sativa]